MEEVSDVVGGQTVEQVALRGCGVSTCGVIQNPPGVGPRKHAAWTVLEQGMMLN